MEQYLVVLMIAKDAYGTKKMTTKKIKGNKNGHTKRL